MKRAPILLLAAAALLPTATLAQQKPDPSKSAPSAAAKIANAITAAPTAISGRATIMDWPTTEGGQPIELRKGSNGWVCYPDLPQTEGNDPMCIDAVWQGFFEAVMAKQPPKIDRVGIGYMTAPGGAWGSNQDPWASAKTPTNEWGYDPPHLMIAVPNTAALQGLPTTRGNADRPWVMFAGSPYAHIMVPVANPKK